MKPIKQRTSFECGPVAIRNALLLMGQKPKSIESLRDLCKTDRTGTSEEAMLNAINKLGLKIKRELRGHIPRMLTYKADLLILGYTTGSEGHYCVVTHDGKNYLAHNWAPDAIIEKGSHTQCKPTAVISKKWLQAKLKQPETEVYVL